MMKNKCFSIIIFCLLASPGFAHPDHSLLDDIDLIHMFEHALWLIIPVLLILIGFYFSNKLFNR